MSCQKNRGNEHIRHQYEVEQGYARRIKGSPKNSPERRKLLWEAYAKVFDIINDYRGAKDIPMEYGGGAYIMPIIEPLLPVRGKFLDIGCGTGSLCAGLGTKGYDVLGIDLSKDCIEKAIKRNAVNCRFENADFMAINPPDKSFDIIINDNVIEHICEDEALDFISRCRSKLKDKGWLVTVTPNRLIGPHDVSRYFVGRGGMAEGLHLKEYTLKELVSLMKAAGFKSVSTLPFSSFYCVRIKYTKPGKLWIYKSLLGEKIFELLPGRLRYPEIFNLLVSNIVLARN